MSKGKHGLGSIKTVRQADGSVKYRALLPRELSSAPPGCKNPKSYQEPLGELLDSKAEARELLNAAILQLRSPSELRHGLPLSHFVAQEIRARHQEARRVYPTEARANRLTSTWRSLDQHWLKRAEFYEWSPKTITADDLQRFVNWLATQDGHKGDPLSSSYVRKCTELLVKAFDKAGVKPNPGRDLDLPSRDTPRVAHLDLPAQRRFFGNDAVQLADRVMVGCGMGAGLRVNELLSLEANDVHLDERDPWLWVQYGGPDRSPTKGREQRRVELFEPGLGFWRMWMRDFYERGQPRVFMGKGGTYRKHWPEKFPGWAEAAGVDRLVSHAMRHSYAVSMLSGTWGYEPQSLEFVSQQLGHADIQTTERYYKKFEADTWRRSVQRMTGRVVVSVSRAIVTAASLLGLEADDEGGGSTTEPFSATGSDGGVNPRQSPQSLAEEGADSADEATKPQRAGALALRALTLLARKDPSGREPGRELARLILSVGLTRMALAVAQGGPFEDERIVELASAVLAEADLGLGVASG